MLTNEYILSKVKSLLKEKLDPELFNKVLDKVSHSFPVFSFRVSLTSGRRSRGALPPGARRSPLR
jgi:hypothetical protein